MSLSVEEVKDNAEYNLKSSFQFSRVLGKEQETNYNIAKKLGADDDDDWSEWEEKVINFKENQKGINNGN